MKYIYTLYDVLQKAELHIVENAIQSNTEEDKQLLKYYFLKSFPKMKKEILKIDKIFSDQVIYTRVVDLISSEVSFYKTYEQRFKFKTDISHVYIETQNEKKSIEKIASCFLNYLFYLCINYSNKSCIDYNITQYLRDAFIHHPDYEKITDKLGSMIKFGHHRQSTFNSWFEFLKIDSPLQLCALISASLVVDTGIIKFESTVKELIAQSGAYNFEKLVDYAIKTCLDKINIDDMSSSMQV